jgi:peptidoglycan/LPS O-acetylase OafA/YrhL
VMDALLHPLFGLLTAIALLQFMTGTCPPVLTGARLKWFGTISFGLYLWHYPILDYGLRWSRSATALPTSVSTILAVPFLLALAVAAATLSYVLVERPFLTRRTAAGTGTPRR